MQTPSAYKWTGPSGQVEFDTESECSAAAAAIGWAKEPLYTEAQMAAAVAAERERWQKWLCVKEWDNVNDPPCHPSDKDWRPCDACAGPSRPA